MSPFLTNKMQIQVARNTGRNIEKHERALEILTTGSHGINLVPGQVHTCFMGIYIHVETIRSQGNTCYLFMHHPTYYDYFESSEIGKAV